MELRPATFDDLNDMTDLMVSAMPTDSQWDWLFPHRLEYPEHHRGIWNVLAGFLRNDYFVINVVTCGTDMPGEKMFVSFAVWEFRCKRIEEQFQVQEPHPQVDGDRPDANIERIKIFAIAATAAARMHFDDEYGNSQVRLWVLGTHPEYQRRGGGEMQCQWGMDYAGENNVPITVLSSPMGRLLYETLGFRVIKDITLQSGGQKEEVSIRVMVYEGSESESELELESPVEE